MDVGRMNQLLGHLERNGLRITEQRRALLRIFADGERFLLPKDVYIRMAALFPGVSFDTIYRNIRLMRDLGVVEQFDFEEGSKFKLSCASIDHREHHHHIICLECEEVVPLPFCPMSVVEIPGSFKVVKHKFEVYGYCSNCLDGAE